MALGATAAAPRGFVQFCERQPVDCGASARELGELRRASAQNEGAPTVAAISFDWASVFTRPAAEAGLAPAAYAAPPAALTFDWTSTFAADRARRELASATPTAAPPVVSPQVTAQAPARLTAVGAEPDRAPASAVKLPMSPTTWSLLTRTNDGVNRAIAQRTDLETYGASEVWALPLVAGLRFGDCEDYVLEKRRALLAAGLPPTVLSIAVVVTSKGETHAVLLVATDEGEYVLDSLTPWVLPWSKTAYQWRERQVSGSASRWAFAAASPSVLLASLH